MVEQVICGKSSRLRRHQAFLRIDPAHDAAQDGNGEQQREKVGDGLNRCYAICAEQSGGKVNKRQKAASLPRCGKLFAPIASMEPVIIMI